MRIRKRSRLVASIDFVKQFLLMARKQGYGVALGQSVAHTRRVAFRSTFGFWQSLGVHITPVHFYEPIPDTRELSQRKILWEKDSELIGVDMNVDHQLMLVRKVFPPFGEEYAFPREQPHVPFDYYLGNQTFGPVDAEVAHSMVRHFLPKKIIEIGSGQSTYLLARACRLNKEKSGVETSLFAIDPYPEDTVFKGFPGLSGYRREKVENIELDFFFQLDAGDILFIDSSHVVRTGGDVNYLFLEVLPRLNPGVIVHVHDIYLPSEYPPVWVFESHHFFSEQYLLQAFLTYNYGYEVLWCGSYMHLHYSQELKAAFPSYDNRQPFRPISFWMRKRV